MEKAPFKGNTFSGRTENFSHRRIYKKEKLSFFDTRTKNEYDVSHLQDAILIGYKEFDFSLVQDVPKDQQIITYCSIGKRSDDIAKKLRQAGFSNVQNMYGGIFEWVNKGYPVVDIQNNPTNKVHAYSRTWGAWLKKGEKVY